MTSGTFERRSGAKLIGWLAALGLMLGAMALEPVLGDLLTTALIAAGAALALALCTFWFLKLDEVAQRAHYVAWFWGGSLGLGLGGVLCLGALATGLIDATTFTALSTALWGGASFHEGLATGMVAVMAPMLLGYSIWWTAFWLRRR